MSASADFEDHEMEEAESGPAMRRERSTDRRHRFFRFDPTFSTGILLNIVSTMVTVAVSLAVMYSSYREDRTAMLKDIEQVKTSASRDRDDLKNAVADLKIDIRDMKSDVRDLSRSVENVNRQQNLRR